MKKSDTSEAGIVSIFVVTMLIVVVSLTVMAFAQIARREQRESLDTQLSAQAFYAAESGVNDAKAAILAKINVGQTVNPKNTCQNNPDYTFQNVLSDTDKVSYTCLLIDPDPTLLPYTIGSIAQILPIQSKSGLGIQTITISWSGSSSSTAGCPAPASAGQFKPAPQWTCAFGGIRMDLVPTSGGSLSQTSLLNGNMTAFLMPTTAGGTATTAYSTGAGVTQGAVVAASGCSSGQCSVTINTLGATQYYMRVSQIYKTSQATISATDTGNAAVEFVGAEANIDVTGKAQDVLRRIVVSAPLTKSNGKVPNASLSTGDSVCKRYTVADGYFALSGTPFAGGGSNPLCGT